MNCSKNQSKHRARFRGGEILVTRLVQARGSFSEPSCFDLLRAKRLHGVDHCGASGGDGQDNELGRDVVGLAG
jgi:hypothetical protein